MRLTQAAPVGGLTVTLASSDDALAVLETVTVPQGQYAATFTATTTDVAATKELPLKG